MDGNINEEIIPSAEIPDKKELQKTVRKVYNRAAAAGAIHFAILQTIATIVQFVLLIVYYAKGGDKDPKAATAYLLSAFPLLIANVISYAAAHPTGALIGFAMTGTVKGSMKMFSKPQIPAIAVIFGIPALFAFHTVTTVLQALFILITGSSGIEKMNTAMLEFGDNTAMNILLFSYLVILAPIGEEIFFRGMIFKHLGCIDTKFGIIMSAVFFGLFHGNIRQFFTAVLLGVFFAYLDVKANSIIPSIILHISNNFIALIRDPIQNAFPDFFSGATLIIFMAVYCAVGLLFLFLTLNKIREKETGKGFFTPRFELPEGNGKGFGMNLMAAAPCFWIYAAIYMVYIVINIVGTGSAQG